MARLQLRAQFTEEEEEVSEAKPNPKLKPTTLSVSRWRVERDREEVAVWSPPPACRKINSSLAHLFLSL
ncbi:hypothetical protein GBA52_023972 [Prunus armeniaca]|nr:hypothetical protein GBA52_023972 [Prunus armeniaca]